MRIAAPFLYLRVGNWQAKKILEMHHVKTYENCCTVPLSKGEQLTGQEDSRNAWRLQKYVLNIDSCFYHSAVRYMCIVLGTLAAGNWFLFVMPIFLYLVFFCCNIVSLSLYLSISISICFQLCFLLLCFHKVSWSCNIYLWSWYLKLHVFQRLVELILCRLVPSTFI